MFSFTSYQHWIFICRTPALFRDDPRPAVAVRGAVLLPDLPDAAAAVRDGGALRPGAGLPHQAVHRHRRQPRRPGAEAAAARTASRGGRRGAVAVPPGARAGQGHVAQEPHGGGAQIQMGCEYLHLIGKRIIQCLTSSIFSTDFPTNSEEPPEPHPGQVIAAGGEKAGRNSRGGGKRGEAQDTATAASPATAATTATAEDEAKANQR